MVEIRDEKYAIALCAIQTIEDIPVEDIKYVESKEVINLRGFCYSNQSGWSDT